MKIFLQLLFVIILCIGGYYNITTPNPWTIISPVDLLIHESGHVFFSPFGTLISFLGGTFIQLFIPFLFLLYFTWSRQFFSSGFCLYWFGGNLINVSWYIKDAISMSLPLVGGGVHDWNYLLTKFGLLSQSQTIGVFFHLLGSLFIIIGLLVCFYVIFAPHFSKQTPPLGHLIR